MNYLSFDVGIKNLAYCCLTENKTIKDWGIINLNENPICDMTLRKKCDKQASYSITNNTLTCNYCSSHIKNKKIIKGKKKKLNTNYDLCQLSKTCITKLRELDLSDIKYVLIENQPALKNPTMKSIQMIIYTFFIIEGLMNDKSSIENIHMVNARNKLKVYKGDPIECNKTNKYARNKYLSIEYTKAMISKEEENFQELFINSKKKDDLADSYLQGIYWIEK
jgi:hypothetical protein